MLTPSRSSDGVKTELDLGTVAHVLQVERRREIIRVLEEDEAIRFSDLVDHLVEQRDDERDGNGARKSEYAMLHQNYLPQLEEYGIVDVSDRGEVISRGDEFEAVSQSLDALAGVIA